MEHNSPATGLPQATTALSLPPEIWSLIAHQLILSSPHTNGHPLLPFACVSRQMYQLSIRILYEHVWVVSTRRPAQMVLSAFRRVNRGFSDSLAMPPPHHITFYRRLSAIRDALLKNPTLATYTKKLSIESVVLETSNPFMSTPLYALVPDILAALSNLKYLAVGLPPDSWEPMKSLRGSVALTHLTLDGEFDPYAAEWILKDQPSLQFLHLVGPSDLRVWPGTLLNLSTYIGRAPMWNQLAPDRHIAYLSCVVRPGVRLSVPGILAMQHVQTLSFVCNNPSQFTVAMPHLKQLELLRLGCKLGFGVKDFRGIPSETIRYIQLLDFYRGYDRRILGTYIHPLFALIPSLKVVDICIGPSDYRCARYTPCEDGSLTSVEVNLREPGLWESWWEVLGDDLLNEVMSR